VTAQLGRKAGKREALAMMLSESDLPDGPLAVVCLSGARARDWQSASALAALQAARVRG
jgi:hypothetical protein